ncbi:hypothetical protein BGX38DRAFT_230452 [Terfezia claveryi]|nr:hypothetical protein BGX38DRAFT_230452 [Terfezia claveryi]
MADSGTVPSQTPPQPGPTVTPPPLPFGWIAQWDPSTKRYYFVQPSTGTTTWEVPTGSVTSTPAQAQPPYTPPVDSYNPKQAHQNPSPSQQYDAQQDPVTTSRGGPLGGLGGLAQGFLAGGGKHGNHGSSGMSGKLGVASALLGGGKQHSGSGGHGSSGHGGPQPGLMGFAGGLLGGKNKHGSGGLLGMAGGLASGLLNQALAPRQVILIW